MINGRLPGTWPVRAELSPFNKRHSVTWFWNRDLSGVCSDLTRCLSLVMRRDIPRPSPQRSVCWREYVIRYPSLLQRQQRPCMKSVFRGDWEYYRRGNWSRYYQRFCHGVGQNVAFHASTTARNSAFLISVLLLLLLFCVRFIRLYFSQSSLKYKVMCAVKGKSDFCSWSDQFVSACYIWLSGGSILVFNQL